MASAQSLIRFWTLCCVSHAMQRNAMYRSSRLASADALGPIGTAMKVSLVAAATYYLVKQQPGLLCAINHPHHAVAKQQLQAF